MKFDAANATICLRAAGGTLPLRIDGKDAWEVHKLFGVATNVMVNTNAQAKGLNGDTKAPVSVGTLNISFTPENFCEKVNAIKIELKNWPIIIGGFLLGVGGAVFAMLVKSEAQLLIFTLGGVLLLVTGFIMKLQYK